MATEEEPKVEEKKQVARLHSSHGSGMESSVFRFKDLNFTVGKGDKEKYILRDVSGTVKWGRKYCRLVDPGCCSRGILGAKKVLNDFSFLL